MKNFFYTVLILLICCFGCKKDKHPTPGDTETGLKIQIIQGNNQKDTVGNLLKDSIRVKITNNGAPVSNYIVQFKRSGCEDASIPEQTTSAGGQASYAWNLSGETGGQTLDIVLLDNNRNKKDSVGATAIGIAALHGWHQGGCVQNFPVNNVSVLSSGRLLLSLNRVDYLYYSDDNSTSWHPLKTFSKSYFISKIVTTGQNEIFLATQDNGVFYSKDNGQNWTNISSGIADAAGFADLAYTSSGKLIFTGDGGVYMSSDKGVTWIESDYLLPDGRCYYPCEQLNGDLYIIGPDSELYKSVDGGNSWANQGTALGNFLLASVESIFIDDNGDMYIGTPHNGPNTNGIIYKSTDSSKTWNSVLSMSSANSSYPNITQISKLGGIYYFSFAGRGVYKTANFSSYSNIGAQFSSYGSLSYTMSKNSTFVLGSPGYGIFYYLP
ncbi:MAG: hypothetical protein JWP37_4479 [Mucilaginibacter sp.]|nr:hypothetical protein [Mucilaginibacter sp.]